MIPLIPEVWSKARATLSEPWSMELVEHSDAAIKGSSALRAGILPACLGESGVEIGVASLALSLDVEKDSAVRGLPSCIDFCGGTDVAGAAIFPGKGNPRQTDATDQIDCSGVPARSGARGFN
eukprot:8003993-Pyramimonas_sp.AAC.1